MASATQFSAYTISLSFHIFLHSSLVSDFVSSLVSSLKKNLIRGKLLYNIVLVSPIQQRKAALSIHVTLPS